MTALTARLQFAQLIARAVRANEVRNSSCPCGVCVMRSCDFSSMKIPSFETFSESYIVPVRNRALCEQYWNTLDSDDRKRSLFYVDYAFSWSNQHNLPQMPAEMWLVTRWWSGIPAPIQRRLEAPIKSPSIVPALSEGAHA